MIGLHNLKQPKGARKKRKLLGRGTSSGHGKTSTRGNKGQGSRAGRDFYPGLEGGQMPLIRKIPKRGFTSRNKTKYQIVNLNQLKKMRDSLVNPDILEKNRLIKNKNKPVKILGEGEIDRAITLEAVAFSKSAENKIKQKGGKCSQR